MGLLNFEQSINLTTSTNNIAPLIVGNLCIASEIKDEIIQYYTKDFLAEDKMAPLSINYSSLLWKNKNKRLTARAVSRIGIKSFPQVGAIGFFKYKYEDKSVILLPVNKKQTQYTAPSISMAVETNTITFTISAPTNITYSCYRIILRNEYFAYEYITYALTLTIDKPIVIGTYEIHCMGYVSEGTSISYDSNYLTLVIADGETSFAPKTNQSYYTKEQIDALLVALSSSLQTAMTYNDDDHSIVIDANNKQIALNSDYITYLDSVI